MTSGTRSCTTTTSSAHAPRGFGLKVWHNRRVVERARQVVVRVVNYGTKPIDPAEYAAPLTLYIASGAIISNELSLTRLPPSPWRSRRRESVSSP
jgi:hypothetical protein